VPARPLVISFVSLLICLCVYVSFIARYGFTPGVSVAMMPHNVSCLGYSPPGVPTFGPGFGFDSTDYWMVARDPFLQRDYSGCVTAYGKVEKRLAYNAQRWLYHLTVFALALGQEDWLKYSAPFLNLLSLFLVTYLWAQILVRRQLNPWWAIPIALNVGVWFGFRFNTADNFLFMLLTAAIYFFEQRKKYAVFLLLLLAMLTRNVAFGLIAVLAVMVVRKRPKEALLYFVASLPYFLVLMPWLKRRFEASGGVHTGLEDLAIPFVTPLSQVSDLIAHHQWPRLVLALSVLFVIVTLLAWCVRDVVRTRQLKFETLLPIGYFLALVSLGNTGWSDGPFHTMRIVCLALSVIMLLLLESRRKQDRYLLYALAAYSLLGPLWLWVTPLVPLKNG